ncbi:MAG: hypothetical protein C0418_02035 [Coriobacteriaceae bacterium]|nr:hypothetical protein [Coriobacteriaceae bacterium]
MPCMERRRFRSLALLLAALVALGACVASSWLDTTRPVLRTVRIPLAGLTREVRILHVSDLQGRTFGRGQRRIADLLEGRSYDAVALTGDMVRDPGEDPAPARELASVLTGVSEMVVSVPGNHDEQDFATLHLADLGVLDLDDSNARVPAGGPSGSLVLTSLRAAPVTRETSADILVVVEHEPPEPERGAELAAPPASADLYLCGHTHAGLIRLPLLGGLIYPPTGDRPTDFFPELSGRPTRGLRDIGGLRVHISPGLGGWDVGPVGIPRVLNRAEITEIVLEPPSE